MRNFIVGILYAVLFLSSPWARSASVTDLAQRSGWAALPGHVLPALSAAQPVVTTQAASRGAEPLTLTVVLRRSDPAGFENYLRDVYDPRSPQYRQFLSPEEVSDRFGPSPADYNAVRIYFEHQGLMVTEESANRLTFTASGTRATAEDALGITIGDYALGERQFFANDTEPQLPADIARRVQAITGLSNLARPRPATKALTAIGCGIEGVNAGFFESTQGRKAYDACIGKIDQCTSGKGLSANDIARVKSWCNQYLPKTTLSSETPGNKETLAAVTWKDATGAGQKIGIMAFDSFAPGDVRDFLDYFGMPSSVLSNLSQVPLNGGAALGPDQREVLLDIDTVLLNAPGAQVTVYHAPFSGGGSFQALFNRALNDGVTIITNSWTYCEDQTTLADVQSIDAILATASAAGVSVFNASGDTGSTCFNGSPNTIGVPAGSPHAMAVGGTSQVTGPTAVYQSETWWGESANRPPTGQGGFGVSRYFARPAYQDGFTASPMRSIPDVAFNADPAQGTIICQASAGGCPAPFLLGGTSMAAPAWAAAAAILNQAQGRNLGNLNLSLYPLANTQVFHSAASMGSDFAHVGLGSVNFNMLHLALTATAAGPVSATESSIRTDAYAVPADGVSTYPVVVRLRDSAGNSVSGKTVTLTANAGSSAVITPASGVTTVDNGAVVFTLTNLVAETVTLTASDITDGVVLTPITVTFEVPPTASAGISASPTSVLNDGASTTTIMVTLKDALNRPTPGKLITLSQGNGHSVITGPSPSVTDANGQIQFTATNQTEETVTYTALDVTDGDLPVPGSASVTFSGSASQSCVGAPPVAANGHTLTPFANGFVAKNFFFSDINFVGCPGASNPVFDPSGSAFIADFPTGALYKMGRQGGAATNANALANLGQTLGQPTFSKDGRLYVGRTATGGGVSTGVILEIDPATGVQVRVVANNLTCLGGIAVDPLSGDLFFDNGCVVGAVDQSMYRVRNPNTAPTVEVYATLPYTGNGAISFAPDGTIFVVSDYYPNPAAPVVRVSGTDKPAPPTVTTIPGVTANYLGVTVAETLPDGSAKSLLVSSGTAPNLVLSLMDLTANPVTSIPLANGVIGPGTIGPDGCLYASAQDTVYKLTTSAGSCGFAPTNPSPALVLSPTTVAPNPAQGSQQTMTAQFVNLTVPADTPVMFSIRGANAQDKLGRTDASGKAAISYTGIFTGADTVVANATVGASNFTSNPARLTWAAGQHVTVLSLNTSPASSTAGMPVTLAGGLFDISVIPTVPITGATLQFAVGGQACNGATSASGIATCSVTLPVAGSYTLTANFAGDAGRLASSAAQSFCVLGNDLPCDVNSDGSVNALDVVAVINQFLGLQTWPRADVNGDGAINALDVVKVINCVLGI